MLGQRVATAAVGIPVILALIFVGGWPYAIAAALGLGVAGGEFAHLRAPWRSALTVVTATGAGIVVLLAYPLGGVLVGGCAVLAAAVAMAGWILAGVPRRDGASRLPDLARWAAAGWLYVAVLGSTMVLLRDLHDGRDWVLLAVFSTFAVDTAAYFTGRTLGRHRMAPAISPKKTWEGFVGGWAGGAAAVIAINLVLDLGARPAAVAALAASLPLAATAGDLFESWLKRRAGVKDASAILPGHGGVLDRLDSLLFTFPLVWLTARFWA